MANVKISDLTAAAAATSTQQFEVNDSGASKSVTGAQLKSFILADDLFPSGGIIIWSGSSAAIPSGWLLCNGTSGTPDLRDRFVVGAGSTYAVGDTGGQNAITSVPAHTHGSGNLVTANAGDHAHNGSTSNTGAHSHTIAKAGTSNSSLTSNANNAGNTNALGNQSTSNTGAHSHNFTTDNAGTHAHNISGDTSSAGNASVDVRPPYYALCYIMKA